MATVSCGGSVTHWRVGGATALRKAGLVDADWSWVACRRFVVAKGSSGRGVMRGWVVVAKGSSGRCVMRGWVVVAKGSSGRGVMRSWVVVAKGSVPNKSPLFCGRKATCLLTTWSGYV